MAPLKSGLGFFGSATGNINHYYHYYYLGEYKSDKIGLCLFSLNIYYNDVYIC